MANVVVENTETHANIIVGRLSMDIIDTIKLHKGEDYKIPEYSSIWNIEIDKDTATDLSRLAMKMKKPIRDQSRKAKTVAASEQTVRPGEEVDAFDLIFGRV